jgi:hypothetical protein
MAPPQPLTTQLMLLTDGMQPGYIADALAGAFSQQLLQVAANRALLAGLDQEVGHLIKRKSP